MDRDDNFHGHCDFVTQNREKMDAIIWFVILFLTLLWILPICQDVENAKTEEIVLDFHLKGPLNVPAELVRVALRIRKLVLPYIATAATYIMLVTDNITSKNAVLNFLAVCLILEADSVVAVLLLNSGHRERMAAVANNVDLTTIETAKAAFILTRVQGLVCAVLLISSISFLGETYLTEGCDGMWDYLSGIIGFPVLAVMVLRLLCILCKTKTNQTCCQKILAGLIDTSQTGLALLIGNWGPWVTINAIEEKTTEFYAVIVISLVGFLLVIGLVAIRHKCYGGDESANVPTLEMASSASSGR